MMEDLRRSGVVFEDYQLPNCTTVNGLVQLGSLKLAWFKDTENNLLELSQTVE